MEMLKNYALRVNPNLILMELSAKTGEGFDQWMNWMKSVIGNRYSVIGNR